MPEFVASYLSVSFAMRGVLMDILYRGAKQEDCPKIATCIYHAADDVLDYLFEDNAANMSATQVLTCGLENEQSYDSYKSVIVAEYEQNVVGAVQSYPFRYHGIDDEMRSFFSEERLNRFEDFYDVRVENSLLVNAMFVDPDFRHRGIGTGLLSHAKTKAQSLGFDKLSLFVLADNSNAQRLYLSFGFTLAKEIRLSGVFNASRKEEIYLMNCDI